MRRVLVLVEGQTEERFVKDMLRPHLWNGQIDVIPTIATTKRVKQGPNFKGGITDYPKVEGDLRRLLGDTGAVAITTFIDYYGLPSDFPGMQSRPSADPIQRAIHVEEQWSRRVGDRRFRAYLMVHEFESLLFSKPDQLGVALHQPEVGRQLILIRQAFPSPEAINDNPQTAPSKRITRLSQAYQKPLHGPMVAKRIGLQTLRQECRHFGAWLDWLEGL